MSLKSWSQLTSRIGAAIALFATAVAVRALPWPTVVTEKHGIQPFGNDAFYHLRRIQYAALNPGDFLSTDRYVNFPHGAQPIWSPTFDWLLAQFVRFMEVARKPAEMELLLVWVPPILGALTVVALFFIARQHFSGWVSALAAAFLCVLPAHFWYSQIGFVDHHVAVALATTLLLGAGLALAQEQPESASPSAQGLRRASMLGVSMAAALLVWPGSLLHVAIVQLFFGLRALGAGRRESAIAWARMLAVMHAIAWMAVIPWTAGNQWTLWGDFSPVVLSNFQPTWFLACALGFALLSELWSREAGAETPVDRSLSAVAIAAFGLGIALVVLPELGEGVLQSWGWFSKAEVFQASVAESAPLFRAPAQRVQELFSRFVYATPLILALIAWDRRRTATPAFWFLLSWAAVLFVATLNQRRFMNSASVAYALILALALEVLVRRWLPRHGRPRLLRAGALVVLIAVVGWAFWPSLNSYGIDLANLQSRSRGEQLHLQHAKRSLLITTSAAQWLRRLTPETRGFFDRHVQPEYSVLTPWSDGHVFKYIARRPVNQDNYGNDVGEENFELANLYYSTEDESEAVSILQGLGARYVTVGIQEVRRTGGYGLRSMFARLALPRSGPQRVVGKGKQTRRVLITRLAQHRLIYESIPFEGKRGTERSYYKLYELVPGAIVEGRAAPGTVVEASLSLFPSLGGEVLFVAAAKTDDQGVYSFRVPYPTETYSEGIRTHKQYTLISQAKRARFKVSEDAVRSGATLRGPTIR